MMNEMMNEDFQQLPVVEDLNKTKFHSIYSLIKKSEYRDYLPTVVDCNN